MHRLVTSLLAAATVATAIPAQADWRVAEGSRVNYVSIKNSSVGENNVISGVSGTLADDGTLRVSLDLATVETGVGIRNERMRDLFFEVTTFATADLTGALAADQLAALEAGQPVRATVALTLSLHGVEKMIEAAVLAVPAGDQIVVTSTAPILLSAADFGLEAGVAQLQQLAGLAAISRVIPVTVDLLLEPAP